MHEALELFVSWLNEAKACSAIKEPTAMTLATADATGRPSARIVLLKGCDARGFTFFTNLGSAKSEQLKQNARAALCFYWMPLDKQVRVEGHVEPVSAEEADAYFASRLRGSQIGAWASQQSQPLASRAILEIALSNLEKTYEGKTVPRPDHWSGWRVVPERMEFWIQGDHRIHDRWVYEQKPDGCSKTLLYP